VRVLQCPCHFPARQRAIPADFRYNPPIGIPEDGLL